MDYDVICIGAGSGGLNIAGFMNRVGMRVLLIDKSDESIGGDCLNYGCVPSKALIHVSRLIQNGRLGKTFGVKQTGKVDLKKVMNYVKSKQEVIREHENADYFRKIGMDVVLGEAKFVSENSVSVNGKKYSGRKIVIATGSRPRKPKIPGIEEIPYLTNETIFDLDKLPKELVVVGGGPIGIEMAQAFNRLGSKVSVIERGDKFLPKETLESAEILRRQLEKEGVAFHFNSTTKKFDSDKGLVIEQGGKEISVGCDALLISIGRELNIEGLELEKAGIDVSNGKIVVDDYLRTTNKNVFVCGDVAGSYQFTHVAELHAGVIIGNFFSPIKRKVSYDNLSWVTYTAPEIATFGLSEATLKKRNINYEKLELNFEEDDRAITDDTTYGKTILYIDKSEKILGGSMVAKNAGELFQELVLINSSGLRLKDIFNKVYPYPTASRVNKKIVSNHFAKKLTPRVKGFLKFMFGKFG
jgi:pyruvate/2-oxoglutarate dehydrogenase complex dihydrolipoamide dehydrogenase (E3) component